MRQEDVIDFVHDGKLDRVVDQLIDTGIARKKVLSQRKARANLENLEWGDKVRTVNLRPKYISGLKGTIIDPEDRPTKPGYLWIDLGMRVRRYGPIVCLPASCV